MKPLARRFYFISGDSVSVDIDVIARVPEVIEAVAQAIGIESAVGWAIYETTPEAEHWIHDREYIADVLSDWESARMFSSTEPGSKEKAHSKHGAKFVFRKRLFGPLPVGRGSWHEDADVASATANALMYAQAVHSVTRADESCVSVGTALELAGLQAQVRWGEPDEDTPNPDWYGDVLSFIPWRLTKVPVNSGGTPPSQWPGLIFQAHLDHGSGRTPNEAMALYLAAVRTHPLYGAAQFEVVNSVGENLPDRLFLVVGGAGIKFVVPSTRAVLPGRSYPYSQVTSIEVDHQGLAIAITVVDTALQTRLGGSPNNSPPRRGSNERRLSDEGPPVVRFVFRSRVAADIAELIASYSPAHRNWTKASESASAAKAKAGKEKFGAATERARHAAELASARANMAQNGYLLPLPKSKSVLSSVVNKLSRRKSREARSSFAGNFEDDSTYPETFWYGAHFSTEAFTR
jgi:myosin-7